MVVVATVAPPMGEGVEAATMLSEDAASRAAVEARRKPGAPEWWWVPPEAFAFAPWQGASREAAGWS